MQGRIDTEEDTDWRTEFTVIMDREIANLREIIFATLQDAIACIRNDGSQVNEVILQIYERHAALFQDMNEEILIEHPAVNNFEE